MRLIDADAFHKYVDDKLEKGEGAFAYGVPYEWAWTLTAVDTAPTIDAVEVVHGRWIENRISATFSCSECGSKINDNRLYAWELHPMEKYCPNCGAKMHCDEND